MIKTTTNTLQILDRLEANGKRLKAQQAKDEKFFSKFDKQVKKIIGGVFK